MIFKPFKVNLIHRTHIIHEFFEKKNHFIFAERQKEHSFRQNVFAQFCVINMSI